MSKKEDMNVGRGHTQWRWAKPHHVVSQASCIRFAYLP